MICHLIGGPQDGATFLWEEPPQYYCINTTAYNEALPVPGKSPPLVTRFFKHVYKAHEMRVTERGRELTYKYEGVKKE